MAEVKKGGQDWSKIGNWVGLGVSVVLLFGLGLHRHGILFTFGLTIGCGTAGWAIGKVLQKAIGQRVGAPAQEEKSEPGIVKALVYVTLLYAVIPILTLEFTRRADLPVLPAEGLGLLASSVVAGVCAWGLVRQKVWAWWTAIVATCIRLAGGFFTLIPLLMGVFMRRILDVTQDKTFWLLFGLPTIGTLVCVVLFILLLTSSARRVYRIGSYATATSAAPPLPSEVPAAAPEVTVEELKQWFRLLDISMALLFCGILAAVWLNSMKRTAIGFAAEIGLILALALVALGYSRVGRRRDAAAEAAQAGMVESLGWWAYVIGGLVAVSSLVLSVLSIPLALAVLIWGVVTRKKGKGVLIGLGALGIVLPIGILFGTFHYASKPDGGWEQAQGMMVQNSLQTLVRELEFYKLQKGKYPAKLEELTETSTNSLFLTAAMMDFSQIRRATPGMTNPPTYHYELDADSTHYYLLARGADGTPYTADDIVPQFVEEERKKTGLLIKQTLPPPEAVPDEPATNSPVAP